jgi:hypothetical protein
VWAAVLFRGNVLKPQLVAKRKRPNNVMRIIVKIKNKYEEFKQNT